MSDHSKDFLVSLIGAPNAGKTTLYNWLTGSKFKTVNYPGSTVEFSIGKVADHYKKNFSVMDTPGTYSLIPKSPDEEVTLKALYSNSTFGTPRVVIAVVDATQLERNLFVAKQLIDAKFNVIIALTMVDLLEKGKYFVDIKKLEKLMGCPVVGIDGRLGGGVVELLEVILKFSPKDPIEVKKLSLTEVETERLELKKISEQVLILNQKFIDKTTTEKLDKFLLSPFWGGIFFVFTMFILFSSIFWLAQPFMDFIDQSFGYISDKIVSMDSTSLWTAFWGQGIVASFGAVMVFVPQVFILFLGIGLLEDSGYLARAATIVDKPFEKMGISGRAFVPLLSGFACAVPAIMATRNIGSRKERMLTMLMIPLMTCSARLPVYALLLSFVFWGQDYWKSGIAMTLIYLLSLMLGIFIVSFINKILPISEKTMFMMELPLYRKPQFKFVFKNSFERTTSYIKRAGPVIFVLAVVVWLGMNLPYNENAEMRIQQSYAAQFGKTIEPVFKPMGVDWKVGVSLMSAFVAREVFVSTLSVLLNIHDQSEEGLRNSLIQSMRQTKDSNGNLVFTLSSVIGLIVFFMIALQCLSTVSIIKKETGSWVFAIAQLIGFNVLAYMLAVFSVYGLRSIGLS